MIYVFILKDNIAKDIIIKAIFEIFECACVFESDFSIQEEKENNQENTIFFELYNLEGKGNFKLMLNIYAKENNALELKIGILLAKTLNTIIVISDDSINPYSWIMINSNGNITKCYQNTVIENDFFEFD